MEVKSQQDNNQAALKFAELYRDCLESFCLIHQGKKEWDRPQRILLVKVGIEQARLLAWSQVMGVCQLGEARSPRLNDPAVFEQVHSLIKEMLDRLVNVDHGIQLATHGLKPSKKASEPLETALDSTRLESFREQYMMLPHAIYATWHKATHWTISDNAKFESFIADTKDSVDRLVRLVDVQSRIDDCIRQDIKAMGWHPVFDRNRAALDGSKLRLIKDSCAQDYPLYAEATKIPMAYLNTQWSDSYQETIRLKYPISTSYGARTTTSSRAEKEKRLSTDSQGRKQSFAGILSKLRTHSWHKSATTANLDDVPRSNSLSVATTQDEELPLEPERSKSDGAILSHASRSSPVTFLHPFRKGSHV